MIERVSFELEIREGRLVLGDFEFRWTEGDFFFIVIRKKSEDGFIGKMIC